MGRKHGEFLIFLVFFSLPTVTCVTCRWPGSILSENVCYLYNSTAYTYFQAKNACQSIGGVLASVKTLTQLMESTAQASDYNSVWIGANDIAVEGTWVWEADGTEATELSGFWQYDYGQPDNYTATEDCADIFVETATKKRIWDDECETPAPFLCMEINLLTTGSTTVLAGSQSTGQSTTTTEGFTSGSTSIKTTSRPTTTTISHTTTSVNSTTKTTIKSGNGVVTTTVKVPNSTLKRSGASLTIINIQFFITVIIFSYLFIKM